MTDILKQTETITEQQALETLLQTVEYRVARSREELQQAYTLVYDEYLKRDYVAASELKLKYSLYNALPQTTTFVAVVDDEVISTATVIPDSPLGLPMDEIYCRELLPLRAQNKKLCEVSMLASQTTLFRNGISVMLNAKKMFFIFYLFKAVHDYVSEVLELDHICITINPKHTSTYEFIMFKDLGNLKSYRNVNGAPALAKYLDLKTVRLECEQRNKEGLYRMFFTRKTPAEKLARKFVMGPEDLRYFFVEKSNLFARTTQEEMEYIKKSYPAYDFSPILGDAPQGDAPRGDTPQS